MQSEERPKPVVTQSDTFSRALCQLRSITSSFDWFTVVSFMIGESDSFGFDFGFTTLVAE